MNRKLTSKELDNLFTAFDDIEYLAKSTWDVADDEWDIEMLENYIEQFDERLDELKLIIKYAYRNSIKLGPNQ